MFDVVAVKIDSGAVRLIDRNRSEQDAEYIVAMAVMRRGVEEEFFAPVPAGKYKGGDKWAGIGEEVSA